jgi:RNA polymerase sigma factor (sigma-70 family)
MAISLVLTDDHPLILDALESLFRLEPDFKVVARCADGEEALDAVRKRRPDVLILDIRLPGKKNGLAVLREMKQEKIATRTVVLTAGLDEDESLEAIRLGVNGIVLKEMAPDLLVKCIRKVHAGEPWIEKRSIGLALERLLKQESGAQQLATLTPREAEVVRMVTRGLHNKEVAEKLGITEGTVKIHLHKIYEKLQIDGRLALMVFAQEKGLK